MVHEHISQCSSCRILPGPLLLGMSHVKSIKALIDGDALTIQFRHPNFSSVIKCNPSNPLTSLPSDYNQAVSSQTNSSVPILRLTSHVYSQGGVPSPTQSFQRITLQFDPGIWSRFVFCWQPHSSDPKSTIKHYGLKATLFPQEFPQESQHLVVQPLLQRCPFQPNFLILRQRLISRCKPKCSPSQPVFPTQEQPPDIPTLNCFHLWSY